MVGCDHAGGIKNMRHTTTETVTFPIVRYSCDVCHESLLVGAKPIICSICGRETHAHCSFDSDYESVGIDRICSRCQQLRDKFLARMRSMREQYYEDLTIVKTSWKLLSLQSDHRGTMTPLAKKVAELFGKPELAVELEAHSTVPPPRRERLSKP